MQVAKKPRFDDMRGELWRAATACDTLCGMPTSDENTSAALDSEQQLRHEIAGLADDEILALCYALKGRLPRLRLYLDMLRKRGGERAQFAACLICFDLARQGDAPMQQEFTLLSTTMEGLAQKPAIVTSLIGDDPYLTFIWELCQAGLEAMHQAGHSSPQSIEVLPQLSDPQADVPRIDLLQDSDFDNFDLGVDARSLWRQFDEAVETFLGGVPGVPVYDMNAGFRWETPHAQDRAQKFVDQLSSLRDLVPPARGFRALALLFMGTNLRSRSLFGSRNTRRQQILRDGLVEFATSAEAVASIAGVLGPMHSDEEVWPKIADVVLHSAQWLAQGSARQPRRLGDYEAPG